MVWQSSHLGSSNLPGFRADQICKPCVKPLPMILSPVLFSLFVVFLVSTLNIPGHFSHDQLGIFNVCFFLSIHVFSCSTKQMKDTQIEWVQGQCSHGNKSCYRVRLICWMDDGQPWDEYTDQYHTIGNPQVKSNMLYGHPANAWSASETQCWIGWCQPRRRPGLACSHDLAPTLLLDWFGKH